MLSLFTSHLFKMSCTDFFYILAINKILKTYQEQIRGMTALVHRSFVPVLTGEIMSQWLMK